METLLQLVAAICMVVEIVYLIIFIKKHNSKRGRLWMFVIANIVIALFSIEAILNGVLGLSYLRQIILVILWAVNAIFDLRWYQKYKEK